MQDKPKMKKERKQIKVHDLKPAKEAKGGTPPDPCRSGRQGSLGAAFSSH